MHLVHVALRLPSGREPQADARERLRAALLPQDGVEYMAVHRVRGPLLTLGFFLVASDEEEAESRVLRLCLRLVSEAPMLRGARLLAVTTPIAPPSDQAHPRGTPGRQAVD
ncbi:hypothetical protein [Streptomyces sp. ODS05-4]|uniref:hypothetical protein n=1 Tax=Streptomyces sp. ODS05-4 TaxID=2944939 RepID=UPI00210AE698|nr:hypothetical protein [Streptomyces sp. ODS05-4]